VKSVLFSNVVELISPPPAKVNMKEFDEWPVRPALVTVIG
jgi:hypothetical protein